MFSIRPNPNYVPGGTENFWVSGSSDSCSPTNNGQLENTKKSGDDKQGGGQTSMPESKEKVKEGVLRKVSQQHFQQMEKLTFFDEKTLMNVFLQKF